MKFKQRKKPCPACPYVKSTPSGIWAKEEYEKLPEYDGETPMQSTALFQCHHTSDKTAIICQGWLDCHGTDHLLAIRLAGMRGEMPENFDLEPSGAEVYSSGQEAMEFGVAEIENPSHEAKVQINELGKMKRIKDGP